MCEWDKGTNHVRLSGCWCLGMIEKLRVFDYRHLLIHIHIGQDVIAKLCFAKEVARVVMLKRMRDKTRIVNLLPKMTTSFISSRL
jgi:hypothetical protein